MRDCGATTHATWRVALTSSGNSQEFGDVFGGDVRGPVRVRWTDPVTLSVKADAIYRRRATGQQPAEWTAGRLDPAGAGRR